MPESGQHIIFRSLLFSLVIAILTTGGCAIQLPDQFSGRARVTERSATAMEAERNYAEAARQYLALASRTSGATAIDYRLRATTALLRGNSPDKAARLLQSLGQPAGGLLLVRYRIAEAEVARFEHRIDAAITILDTLSARPMSQKLRAEYFTSLARVNEQAARYLPAVTARIALGRLIRDAQAARENRLAIWSALMQLDRVTLDATSHDTELSGWLALARHVQEALFDSSEFAQRIGRWRDTWPQHPGDGEIIPMLMISSHEQTLRPTHIGLILPLTGNFSGPASAVRDGFLSAWFEDQDNPARPQVSIYDADSTHIWEALNNALSDGVDFIVGPLDKPSVAILQRSERLPVTTLALNRIGSDSDAATHGPDNLYQFGLTPEGEARQVARMAWFAGHLQAAVIVPDSDWGTRVAEAFTQHWMELGGEVVETRRFTPDARDLANAIKSMLRIDSSGQRIRALKLRLDEKIESETRRRQDIDFVFLAAFPKEARQLRPQLSFHKAADIPVYATSHVYTGTPDAEADRDMNKVFFADMPWVLNTDRPEYNLQKTVEKTWPKSATRFRRLYALGIDAYTVVPHLARLKSQPFGRFEGETGILSVSEDSVVSRELRWAQFRAGLARLVTP